MRNIIKLFKLIFNRGGQYASIDNLRKTGMVIGNGCEIYSTASFGSEPYLIHLGDCVRINQGVHFVTHDGGVWVLRNLEGFDEFKDVDLFGEITVGNNVHIGTNAIIMPGVTIGDNVIIGCAAVVCHDIPNNSVAVGIPARVIKTVDEYMTKNKEKLVHTKAMTYEEKKHFLLEEIKYTKIK